MKRPPSTGVLVFLRVLFVVISVCSLGFLTASMMLRLALVTRKALDWALFVAVVAIDVLAMVLIGKDPGDEIDTAIGYTGLTLLLVTVAAVVVYYLTAEIRHYHDRRLRYGPYPPAPAPAPAYGYPQPQPQPPYTATTVSQMPPVQRPPHTPAPPSAPHGTPAPHAPHTPPPTARPATPTPPPQRPARIDEVRAELDELSDYLRNQDGRPEGGR
ncbi:hypothetical protein ACFRI7_25470 [Streptomyces sp. NPDC056716]|uniref:hypothetical protein n=1 Tax=unclassified Streptomyces TaxID=2593676 RepID=UPI0036B3171C